MPSSETCAVIRETEAYRILLKLFFFFCLLKICLKGRVTQRDTSLQSTCSLCKCTARTEPAKTRRQEPRAPLSYTGLPHGTPAAAFPGTTAGRWIKSGAAGTPTLHLHRILPHYTKMLPSLENFLQEGKVQGSNVT